MPKKREAMQADCYDEGGDSASEDEAYDDDGEEGQGGGGWDGNQRDTRSLFGGPDDPDDESKLSSDDLYALMVVKLKNIVDTVDTWGEGYATEEVRGKGCMKLYLINIGDPRRNRGDNPAEVALRKTLKAYSGASRDVAARMQMHNHPDRGKRPHRTRHGTSWTLCMTVYIPERMRKMVTTRLVRDYLRAAHGIGPKYRRFKEVCNFYHLVYDVPPAYRELAEGYFADANPYTGLWDELRASSHDAISERLNSSDDCVI